MNKIIMLFTFITISLFTSCVSQQTYYQLQKTKSDNVQFIDSNYVYENNDVKIVYDLWENDGNPGFFFYNKTEKMLYLNLDESFFIINGIANDYYQNRVWTSSQSSSEGTSEGSALNFTKSLSKVLLRSVVSKSESLSLSSSEINLSSDESGIYQIEKRIFKIPPKSAKQVFEFTITGNIYRSCDLLRFPDEDEVKSVTFSKKTSPYIFSNRLSFSFNSDLTDAKTIVNEFWVDEITNFPEDLFFYYRNKKFCNEESYEDFQFYKYYSPDSYYIRYLKKNKNSNNSFDKRNHDYFIH